MTILTIDFEASCLPKHGRSFPIEVGIAGAGFPARCWIIKPHADWNGWDWTSQAQALHGLTRERIADEGLPADIVLAQLSAAVAGRRVVADSMIDQYWLETLAAAAGMPAPFHIDHIALVLDEQGVDEAHITSAVAYADAHYPARHRAVADALWLAAIVGQVTGQAEDVTFAPILLPQC